MKKFLTIAAVLVLMLAGDSVPLASQAHVHAAASMASPTDASAKDGVTVVIDNFTFMAPNLTIPAGTKVTWINHDDVPHTVVSTEQKFKSKALDTDESFSFTFTEPGKYPYFCSIHPKMVANVVVTANK